MTRTPKRSACNISANSWQSGVSMSAPPGADWDGMETQQIGLRIEYLGGLVKRHADAISDMVGEIRNTAERMAWKGGAQ
jgi:hypothetical protein